MINGETRKNLYYEMLRVRLVEEGVADAYSKQQMRCPVHLSIGQEAVPVGISAHLSIEDKVYSTHRCHAHYLAKGGGIAEMIAELHNKSTGCAKGKGGSMHLVDTAKGMMGSSALVAGTIPIATGSAFSMKQRGLKNVAVAYFGDGGSEEGIFYESMNFAMLHKLPVLFVCENNNYATYSPQRAREVTSDIYRRGESFGIAAARVDGNDVEAIYQIAGEAIQRGRHGEGPTLLEFMTARWRDHVGPNYDVQVGYRTQEEVDYWMERCPIKKLGDALIAEGLMTQDEEKAMRAKLDKEIQDGFAFAESSPLPNQDEVFSDVYA